MSTVKLNIEVPTWIAECLKEMCEEEAEYWGLSYTVREHEISGQWEKLAGDIWAAIESSKEDQCTSDCASG